MNIFILCQKFGVFSEVFSSKSLVLLFVFVNIVAVDLKLVSEIRRQNVFNRRNERHNKIKIKKQQQLSDSGRLAEEVAFVPAIKFMLITDFAALLLVSMGGMI